MKIHLTTLTLLILGLSVQAAGQTARLDGYVSDDQGARVTGVRIVAAPGNQAATTDGKGHFTITLPGDIQPGQATQIILARDGWVIFTPLFGVCVTQSAGRDAEPLTVVVAPRGSRLALSPETLKAVIAKWAAE